MVVCVTLAVMLGIPQCDSPPIARDGIAAPLVYADMMLILVERDEIAAFVFKDEIEKGVRYEFRIFSRMTGKVSNGTGFVREKFKEITDGSSLSKKDGKVRKMFVDDGSVFCIRAGKIQVGWTYSKRGVGWIYYQPEKTRAQIAHSEDFQTIDLRRFIWDDAKMKPK